MIEKQYDLNEILDSLKNAIKHIEKLIQEDKETNELLKCLEDKDNGNISKSIRS